MRVLIKHSGLYRFSNKTVTVYKGHLELDGGVFLKKGYAATAPPVPR